MSLSDNYPDIRPLWMNDYANAGVIDPRCSFARSDSTPSNVHYWSDEDHLSSENLIAYSSDISNSYWTKQGVSPTGGQTAPDGGTDAYKLTENSSTSDHRIYHLFGPTPTDATTITFYAKYIARQWIYVRAKDVGGTNRYCWFDIQNGVVGTQQTNITATIAASGNGYYKCTVALASAIASGQSLVIGGAAADGDGAGYAGLNGDAFALWGINMSTLGETTLNETSGQIHREYAATLKSVASSGQPRFEYEPTGDRSARGLLIESSVSNVMPFSTNGYNASNSFVWSSNYIGAKQNAAIAPSGNLEATLIHEDGTANQHNFYRTITGTAAPYTYSIYVKDAGVGSVGFRLLGPSSYGLNFNLSDGSTSTFYNTVEGYGFEDVGNGWKRIWVTKTLTAASWHMMIYLTRGGVNYTGDNYSGVLWYGAMVEQSSFPSSYIDTGTSGSASTRTGDSLSVTDSSLFDTGSGSLVVEAVVKSLNDGVAAWLGTDGNNYHQVGQFSSTTYPLISKSDGVASAVLSSPAVSTGAAHKVGASWDTNDFAACVDGGTVVTDTSGTLPAVNKLTVGNYNAVAAWLDGHVKRVAVYNESLTDTELQSLTS